MTFPSFWSAFTKFRILACTLKVIHRQQTNPCKSPTWYSTQQSFLSPFFKLIDYWWVWLTMPPNTLITSFCCYLRGKNVCVCVCVCVCRWRRPALASEWRKVSRGEHAEWTAKAIISSSEGNSYSKQRHYDLHAGEHGFVLPVRDGCMDGRGRREEKFLFMGNFSTGGWPT
jgi:hypothetical protein